MGVKVKVNEEGNLIAEITLPKRPSTRILLKALIMKSEGIDIKKNIEIVGRQVFFAGEEIFAPTKQRKILKKVLEGKELTYEEYKTVLETLELDISTLIAALIPEKIMTMIELLDL